MPALCFCYEVHEPYQLRRYTVFDMGQNSIYEDDDHNCEALLRAARLCYLPANELMLRLIRRYDGAFRLSFSISGVALDLFEQYTPEVLESFTALARTGCVEFVAETAPHSLAFLYSRQDFDRQVREQSARLEHLFGVKPVTFKNTECVYNNDLAAAVAGHGFRAVLAEGADHVLGWRSANYLYRPASAPGLALLLRNAGLSGDVGLRFSDHSWPAWPLRAETFAAWCHGLEGSADIINIFNDYHVFGLRHDKESGIFDFMEALPGALLAHEEFSFTTPALAAENLRPVGEVDVPQFMSWEDEGRDLTAWLGNDMQKDAIHALYAMGPRTAACNSALRRDFDRLQTADHFRHMSTKWFSNEAPDRPSPFASPYDAYITYMNVLADFELRLKADESARATAAAAGKPADAAPVAKARGRVGADAARNNGTKSAVKNAGSPAPRRGGKSPAEIQDANSADTRAAGSKKTGTTRANQEKKPATLRKSRKNA
nr:glycoside hydrolase family 57 protein [uncultured Desulfovibrio sp.]